MQIKYILILENLLRNSQSINRVIFSHFLITRRINCKLQLFFTVVLKENPGYPTPPALRASSHRHPLPASHFSMVFCWCQSRADDRFPCTNAVPVTFPMLLQPSQASSFPHHLGNECASLTPLEGRGWSALRCSHMLSVTGHPLLFHHVSHHQGSSSPWLLPLLLMIFNNLGVLMRKWNYYPCRF